MMLNLPINSQEEALAAACACLRFASIQYIQGARDLALRAESVGPLINPSAWTGRDTFKRHAANIDVLRRALDLRSAIADADEICCDYTGALDAPMEILPFNKPK